MNARTIVWGVAGALMALSPFMLASVSRNASPTYDIMSLNGGNDSTCHDYLISDRATPEAIAAMLTDAAAGARRYGCVNIIVEHS